MIEPISEWSHRLLFWVLLLSGVGFFARTLFKRFHQIVRGRRPENRFDHLGLRIKRLFGTGIGQDRLPANGYLYSGILHLFIFCSFAVLLADTASFMLNGLLASVGLSARISLPLLYEHLADGARLLCLVGVAMAYINRLIIRPKHLPLTKDGLITLTFIACHMLFELGEKSFAFALAPNESASWLAAALGSHLPASEWTAFLLWWGHLICLLSFLCFIPFSKHFHVLTAPVNLICADLSPRGCLRKLELDEAEDEREGEEEIHFGAKQMEDLSWKQILDAFSCAQCGRCTDVCPAARAGAPLKPFDLIKTLRRRAQTDDQSDFFDEKDSLISKEALWSCTTCRACMEVCAVRNEHVPLLMDLRRYQTLTLGEVGPGAANALKQMERKSNPWGLSKRDRESWLGDAPRWDRAKPQDFLLFLGCNAAFDEHGQKSARALMKIFDACGVSYGVLGSSERCCGETARRLGDEYLFQNMASALIDEFKKQSVTRVITACPHCFNTFKDEYPTLGAEFEVIHSSEFLLNLLHQKKLQLRSAQPESQMRAVYHDPCYLGRYHDLYDPARELLDACPDVIRVEAMHARRRAFCCGGGGGQMWMENKQRPNRQRYAELAQTGAEAIVVHCGFCATQLGDASAASENSLPVKDLAEILAERLAVQTEPEETKNV